MPSRCQPMVQLPGRHDYRLGRQHTEIVALLKDYEMALNAADTDAVTALYTDDAVVSAPDAPPSVGLQAVRNSYVGTFNAIHTALKFDIAEVKLVSNEGAFARSTSSGSITIVANGAQVPAGFQELFVLRKQRGEWKIARYSFSSTLPAAK